MADKKIIVASVQVDTGNSVQNLKGVTAATTEAQTALDKTSTQATKTGAQIESAGGSFGKIKGQIAGLPGPLGAAQEGVGKVGVAFKALLANPVALFITAIVVALTAIYKAFTNTFEGGQKVEQIFAAIKAAGQALLDNLDKIGSAIVKVFKFDFSGAVKEINDVKNAAVSAARETANITKQLQQIRQEDLKGDVDDAQRRTRLALLKEELQSEESSFARKKEIAKQLRDDAIAERDQSEKDDTKRTELQIRLLTIQRDGEKKNAEEISQLRVKLEDDKREKTLEVINVTRQLSRVEKEEAAEFKARAAEQEALNKEAAAKAKERAKEREEALKKIAALEKELAKSRKAAQAQQIVDDQAFGAQLAKEDQARLDAEVARLNNNQAVLLETKKKLAELNLLDNPDSIEAKSEKIDADLQLELSKLAEGDVQRQILAKKASDEQVKIKEDEANAKMQIAEEERLYNEYVADSIANGLETLSEIAGKQTAIGKGLAIASTTIKTYQSAIAAFQGIVSTIPGPVGIVLGGVAAAGAIATGLNAVKKIISVKVPGAAGGGSAPTSIQTPSAPIAPTATSTRLDQDSLNGIGNAAVRPIQAYVVQSQGADETERAERLNRAARLGG